MPLEVWGGIEINLDTFSDDDAYTLTEIEIFCITIIELNN